jgi:hypothetical protein
LAPLTPQVTEGDLSRASFAVIGRAPTMAVLGFGGTVQTFTYEAQNATWEAMAPLAADDRSDLVLCAGRGLDDPRDPEHVGRAVRQELVCAGDTGRHDGEYENK